MSSSTSAKAPLLLAAALVAAGLIIAAVGGLTAGSIPGGLIAAAGLIPSCYAAWKGMQQETQASLASALGMVFVSLGVGGILIILAIIDWLR